MTLTGTGCSAGCYLPHLRRAVYAALLALERLLDQFDPRATSLCLDLDLDGVDELFLRNGELQAVVKLDGSAAMVELDAYALAQNFGDTLRRHASTITGACSAGRQRCPRAAASPPPMTAST